MRRTTLAAAVVGVALGGIVAAQAVRLPAWRVGTPGAASRSQVYGSPNPAVPVVGMPNSWIGVESPLTVTPMKLGPSGVLPTAARGRIPPWSIETIPGQ